MLERLLQDAVIDKEKALLTHGSNLLIDFRLVFVKASGWLSKNTIDIFKKIYTKTIQ